MFGKRLWLIGVIVMLACLANSAGALAAPIAPDAILQTAPPDIPGRHPAIEAGMPLMQGENGTIEAEAIALGKPGMTFKAGSIFGTTLAPYLVDAAHFNALNGLLFDASGNMFVTEETGARLLKYDSSGNPVWQSGNGGVHDWGVSGYSWPRDVAQAPDGTLWVANYEIATHVGTDGSVLGHFPAEPWNVEEDQRFGEMFGIAFDSGGRLYISDAGRHRIQVFTFDGDGYPVYAATFGETDNPGDGSGQFNRPGQIAIDAGNNVFVTDRDNFRVQRCEPTSGSWPWGWTCSTYAGGNGQGSNPDQLNNAGGIGMDGSVVYIADSNNARVMRCTAAHTCTVIVDAGCAYPSDVAVEPEGQIYIADQWRGVVWHYTGSNEVNEVYVGELDVPYLSDSSHLHWPHGVEVDNKGAIIVLEESGNRMIKYGKDGSVKWVVGEAGIWGLDDTHLAGPRAVTTDSKGKIYVTDSRGLRIFDSNGKFLNTLPQPAGDDRYVFSWLTGGAVDSSGNIYLSDTNRNRVTVYNKKYGFVRQIGVTDECARDNMHLCAPMGITLDKSGNLYVSEWGNYRVQKFDKKGKFLMTFGTMMEGNQIGRMSGAVDVAVDSKGNVYVAEENNSRITVYNKSGGYLTTISGSWGDSPGKLRGVGGLSLDKSGNVYVTDPNNARVQAFNLGVPYWAQVNINGFGQSENHWIGALGVFKKQLYAGVNSYGGGEGDAQIWRLEKSSWTPVVTDGFGDGAMWVLSLTEYKNYLYATTQNGQVWRSPDGLTWQAVVLDGFGSEGTDFMLLPGTMNGNLCVSTANQTFGAELWCSATGEAGTWVREVALIELSDPYGFQINDLVEFNGTAYISTNNWIDEAWPGAQIFRNTGIDDWVQVNDDGFGNPENTGVHSLAVFNGYLYAATQRARGTSSSRVYRCKLCDGTDWLEVTPTGLPATSTQMTALQIVGKILYAVFGDEQVGVSVWSTTDGLVWKQVVSYGFSDPGNIFVWSHDAVTEFNKSLYIGTNNSVNGAQIWKHCPTKKSCK